MSEYPCKGMVKVYDYFVTITSGAIFIKDKNMNVVGKTYTTHNAVDKVTKLVLNALDDYNVNKYMEVHENVKKLVEGIDCE